MLPVEKRIGIIGTRRRNEEEDYLLLEAAFLLIHNEGDTIVSGGCPKGGDAFAERLAKKYSIPIKIHYPDKSSLDGKLMKVNPRAAYAKINYARNTLIANDSDILIAVVSSDRKGGTEDTIKKFLKRKTERYLLLL